MSNEKKKLSLTAMVGPGLLVAATGVGAGDLGAGGFAGNKLGPAILWAVVLGALLKYVLTEGLARWQLATGDTLLEGCVRYMGRPFQVAFLLFLVTWSFFVGSALMSACGVTLHAILPLFENPDTNKIVYGVACSLLGVVLVRLGGYRLFENVMKVCIGVMFVTVVIAAVSLRPDWGAVLKGLLVPTIPQFRDGGLAWTIALIGGIGGTLTLLSYGYWIREEGREGKKALHTCRVDLASGYVMTAVFGMSMIIIGHAAEVDAKGSKLIVGVAERLHEVLGPVGQWFFLIGALGAVFSSLLGVWQSVPYIFADFCGLALGDDDEKRAKRVSASSNTYTVFLVALALVPMLNLTSSFKEVQKYYAVFGAFFMPFLAFVMLYLNGRASLVGEDMKNRPLTNVFLILVLVFFGCAGALSIQGALAS
jgi:Mn2+/Fe2+ NRAMP family transporter